MMDEDPAKRQRAIAIFRHRLVICVQIVKKHNTADMKGLKD